MNFDAGTLIALGALVVAALALALLRVRGKGSRRAKRRARRAVRGEARAMALLEAEGFVILDNQAGGQATITVDGQVHQFELRADYLVEQGGRRWVAEVKTGDVVTRLAHGATRRQLMEYMLAFDAHGVLLVTPEDGRVREVAFPALGRRGGMGRLAWFILGLLVGAGALYYYLGGN